MFADDSNAYKLMPNDLEDYKCFDLMADLADKIREWGLANDVLFEPSKENYVIMRRVGGTPQEFRFLGITFDNHFTMHLAVREVVRSCNVKVNIIYRLTGYYGLRDLIFLYKSHVLSSIEYRTCAFFHIPESAVYPVDMMQHRFLDTFGLSAADAFIYSNWLRWSAEDASLCWGCF